MGSITKHRSGYRVAIDKQGVRASKVLPTMKEARNWETKTEADILAGVSGIFPRKTFEETLDRYMEKISPRKAGVRWERTRLTALKKECPALVAKQLTAVTTEDMIEWRDMRLKTVTPGTVQRDINLISNVFHVARKEWKWCAGSPTSNMKGPGENAPRTQRIKWQDVRKLCRSLNYVTGKVELKTQEAAVAFLICLRTGLRTGELLQLKDADINLTTRVLVLNKHKTMWATKAPRRVPFTKQARRLFGYLSGRGQLFTMSASVLDTYFRRARSRTGLTDIHFHDSRAEALTRLSKKVAVETLQKISGHTDVNILTKHYYRESAEDIAARI